MHVVQQILREMNEIGRTWKHGGTSTAPTTTTPATERTSPKRTDVYRDSCDKGGRSHLGLCQIGDGIGEGSATLVDSWQICALAESTFDSTRAENSSNAQISSKNSQLPPNGDGATVCVGTSSRVEKKAVLPSRADA